MRTRWALASERCSVQWTGCPAAYCAWSCCPYDQYARALQAPCQDYVRSCAGSLAILQNSQSLTGINVLLLVNLYFYKRIAIYLEIEFDSVTTEQNYSTLIRIIIELMNVQCKSY